MEIWIEDKEIIDRIYKRILDLSEDIKMRYDNSNLSIESVSYTHLTLPTNLRV